MQKDPLRLFFLILWVRSQRVYVGLPGLGIFRLLMMTQKPGMRL